MATPLHFPLLPVWPSIFVEILREALCGESVFD